MKMNTRKLTSYLKKVLPYFLLSCGIFFVFSAIFALMDLDWSGYFLALELVLFLGLLMLITGYVFFQKRASLEEEKLQLAEDLTRLRTDRDRERKDLQEYFLTWLHQMKTPITAVKLMADRRDGDEEMRMVKQQILSIENYANMAMHYLKLQDMDKDLDLREFCLDDVIRPLMKKYAFLFIDSGNRLVYEAIEDKVSSDSFWLMVLLEQILSNALKYTDHGEITLRYDGDRSLLSISDTGIGIRPEDREKIFNRGYSGFNGRMNEKSSGLGLFLAKQIALRLSIRICLDSHLGQGTTFYLQFPLPMIRD